VIVICACLQVRDLMVFIEAGRTIEASGDLKDATVLPVPAPAAARTNSGRARRGR
jgi:hypothetical protein